MAARKSTAKSKGKAKKPTRPAKLLPPIPEVVHTMIGPVTVSWVEGLTDREAAAGKFEWRSRTIQLDTQLSRHSAWMTLRHEIVHAWLMDAGIITLPHELEERLCDVFAAALMYEMQYGL